MQHISSLLTSGLILSCGITAVGCGMLSTKNKGKKASENDQRLIGEWLDTCNKMDWLGFAYQQQTLRFSALGDFDRDVTLFKDSTCANPIGKLSEHGTYASLGNSSNAPDAKDINFTVTEVTMSAETDDAISLLNSASYCGISDWKKGNPTDILGKSCTGMTRAKGDVVFDIYRVDTNGKRLINGKGSLFLDKTDMRSRPSSLDENRAFRKQ